MAYLNPNLSASGASFAQLQAGGLSAIIEKVITVNYAAELNPTAAPTLSQTGSGGTLPAATYWCVQTETNGYGETLGTSASASQAITLGQKLVITPAALQTGNVGRNYYLGTTSTGPFTLVATGQTAAATTISATLPSNSYAVNPPTINSTAFSFTDGNGNTMNFGYSNVRAGERGNLQNVYNNVAAAIDAFLHGDPVSFPSVIAKLRHGHLAFAAIAQALADIGGLVDANAGTIKPTATGIGNTQPQRTWP
jgi:hypothetical protein